MELINYLKSFLRDESFPSQCPIRLAQIYGDQPPSAILEASNLEEKVGYFIAPLKRRKKSDERHCRTCANGTWRGQTSGKHIKNRKGSVNIKEKEVKEVEVTEQDVARTIEAMLYEPQDDYCTKTQKMNEGYCSYYQQEMSWADDVLIDIDDLIW
ncbi:uncharacterized protein LOC132612858 [Lycium barbarum]|uniref:uncharacterized protein LOC132612858 n=1 Tax=Lycium barbarum TaxID=112863 RepID=UPI00293ECBA4|nr:uncharacterized protein LOC132612858 [Lycium barbarum]